MRGDVTSAACCRGTWGPWALGLVLATAIGCGGDAGQQVLAVDLRTDYVPGVEFASVRVELRKAVPDAGGGRRVIQDVPVRLGDDFGKGKRLTDFPLSEGGTYALSATLLQLDGEEVASRSVRIQVRSGRTVTIVVTRSCAAVSCPGATDPPEATSCLGGRCVSPDCTPETPERCGEPACTSPADCPAPADCAEAICADGVCLLAPRAGACPTETWCHPERGCVALPMSDGGSGCEASAETCNGLDDDCDGEVDEDFDLLTDPRHCGECGRVCGDAHATASCEAGRCTLRCDEGFADCDDDPTNGCEADLSAPESCGGCGTRCEGETPLCVRDETSGGYRCVSECPPEAPTLCTGSCVDTQTSLAHCGGCERPCEAPHGTATCTSGTCTLGGCDPGWGDCNGRLEDGCETDLTTPTDCGSCGTACPADRPYCRTTSGGTPSCTDGCSDGIRNGTESDVDCGGELCPACTEGRGCNGDRDCGADLVCRGGRCVPCGECSPGQTETQPCGNCGTRSRSCSSACSWGGWSACSGEGVCSPGQTETQPCGNCGTQSRSCSSACSWGGWSACSGEGVCSPGSTTNSGCPNTCMAKTCDSSCSWNAECSVCSSSCSQFTTCGSSCPSGYYPSQYRYTSGCGGSGISNNSVRCHPACGSQFTTCGSSCPSGYYPSQYRYTSGCGGSGISDNSTVCRRVTGTMFTSCGSSCPSGYHPVQYRYTSGCGGSGISNNSVVCRKN